MVQNWNTMWLWGLVTEIPRIITEHPIRLVTRPTTTQKFKTATYLTFKTDEKKSIKNPFIIPGIQKLQIDPQLKHDNTFENFVEGDCNRLARSAGYAVARNPGGTAFNPLMIYGNSGLGKTHLAQAIGIEVKEQMPDKVVLYVNANKFQTQFTEATRNNNRNDFCISTK
jgi:chromosomal replication initiator protein